jgi:formylglycine-generating enzyme required for sulfatase activity
LLLTLVSCGPSQEQQIATVTQIAADTIATQTALVPTPTATPDFDPGGTRQSEVDGMTLVFIPGGEYTLGSNDEDIEWAVQQCSKFMPECSASSFEHEKPLHTVWLDAFWIDQTEITVAMFSEFIEATGYQTEAERVQYSLIFDEEEWVLTRDLDWKHPYEPDEPAADSDPVVHVSWYDAWSYCQWADRRLPTEAEWEAAARGDDLRRFPWGDTLPIGTMVNLADRNAEDTPWRNEAVDDGFVAAAPAGSYEDGASPFGVLNMGGNVQEWVYDTYSSNFNLPDDAENPFNVSVGRGRVIRGGSFATIITSARAARRSWSDPATTSNDYGFRCVSSAISLPEPVERDAELPEFTILEGPVKVFQTPFGKPQIGLLANSNNVEITGQYNLCRRLRISSPQFDEGWIIQSQDQVVLYKDCESIEEVLARPFSSYHSFYSEGKGSLTVRNEGSKDAVVFAVRQGGEDNEVAFRLYVRSGEEARAQRVRDGQYEIYITSGSSWVPYELRFQNGATYEKLADPLEFDTRDGYPDRWELVLSTTEAGEAAGSYQIPESEFPE